MTEQTKLPCADFGNRLKSLRQQANITTQRELVERLGSIGVYYDYTVVSHWEKGRRCPPLETILAIVQILVEAGGIKDIDTANELLNLANMRHLTEDEIARIFGDLRNTTEPPELMTEEKSESSVCPRVFAMPPSQLPKAYHRLIGRHDEIGRLLNALREPRGKPMIAVEGLGGIGKTALTLELIEISQKEGLFEHVVWSSAKPEYFVGESAIKSGVSDYTFDTLLGDIGRQCDRLDIPQLPAEQKRAAVRYLLKKKRVLVVMDNLETVSESAKLVHDAFLILGQSKLIFTSRHHIKHERVFTVKLSGFRQDEGVTFLREESKERSIEAVAQADQADLIQIHKVTGGAPLAMKLVVGQMYRQPMNTVLSTLERAMFKGQDYPFYRFVYQHSWQMLDLNGRKALVDMSVFPPLTGGAVHDVEVVSQVESSAFWPAMDRLVLMSLVDKIGSAGQERFALHPLTQYFVKADITKEWAEA